MQTSTLDRSMKFSMSISGPATVGVVDGFMDSLLILFLWTALIETQTAPGRSVQDPKKN